MIAKSPRPPASTPGAPPARPRPGSATTDGGYTLDNHHPASPAHHQALAELLDPHTRRRILALPHWPTVRSCLEVGAGSGSLAHWLVAQLGPGGRVVATDLKPAHLTPHPRLTGLAHDLTDPGAWPRALAGPFDLIIARLVLGHLPQRSAILPRLIRRLAPGGVILVESWSPVPPAQVVVAAPGPGVTDLYRRFAQRLTAVLTEAGGDPHWGRHLHAALVGHGLVEVDTVIHGGYWAGGGPGLRVVSAVAAQLRPRLRTVGLTDAELDTLARSFQDPGLVVHGHLLYSTAGRRPRA